MLEKLSSPEAILFDWDNTLVDTFPIIYSALNKTFKAMGKEEWAEHDVRTGRQGIHRALRESFPDIFGDKWQEAREHYYKYFLEVHLDKIKKLSGADHTLQWLSQHDVFIGIVSNKTGEYLRQEVSHLGWNGYFDRIVGATDANADKPASDPVHLILKDTNIAPSSNVWLIGDSMTDMECAHNTGIQGIYFGNEIKSPALSQHLEMYHIPHCRDHGELLQCLYDASKHW